MCNWIFCYHEDPVFLSSVLCWMNCFSPLQKMPPKATLTFFFPSTLVLEFYLPEYFCFVSDNENISVPNVTIILLFSRTAPADLSKNSPWHYGEARLEKSIGTFFNRLQGMIFFHVQMFTQHLYFYPPNNQERSTGSLPWKCFASCNFCASDWDKIKCMI